MKIIKNEKLIKRNAKIGTWTSLVAIAVLGLGMYISFTQPNLVVYSALALILGFALTQIGMYMGVRYGRSPRPDEKLDAGLKGLSNEYTLYHYETPAPHLLVGPAGLWVILPYHQLGQVTYSKNRWRISGGGFLQAYMRIFGQEGLGRPDIEVENAIRSLKKHLEEHMEESEIPEIDALMVFTHERVELNVEGAPVPAIKLKQLKDFIRQKAKERKIPAEKISAWKAVLE
jgi:hypothetical protein